MVLPPSSASSAPRSSSRAVRTLRRTGGVDGGAASAVAPVTIGICWSVTGAFEPTTSTSSFALPTAADERSMVCGVCLCAGALCLAASSPPRTAQRCGSLADCIGVGCSNRQREQAKSTRDERKAALDIATTPMTAMIASVGVGRSKKKTTALHRSRCLRHVFTRNTTCGWLVGWLVGWVGGWIPVGRCAGWLVVGALARGCFFSLCNRQTPVS